MIGRAVAVGTLCAAVLAATAAMAAPPDPGEAPMTAAVVEPVQYRDRRLSGGRESLFEPPTLRRPESLLRPRSGRLGPHYEPPPVVYEPPPVTYRPPSLAERGRGGRCAPRTRAWYASCSARFRSFDPNRGTYTTYSGQERPCRCP